MAQTRRIFVVDTDADLLRAVATLADEIDAACDPFLKAEDFLKHFPRHTGELRCLICGIQLPGMSGVELQDTLIRTRSKLPIIFVTEQCDIRSIVRAMKNEAVTVLEKPTDQQMLREAVRDAFELGTRFHRIDRRHADMRTRLSGLTDKEREVLDLMMAGVPNKGIARRLDVGLRTVENRRHHIFEKMGTRSLAVLVQRVVQLGDIEIDLPEAGEMD